jgi:uncharacterized protein
MKVVYLHGFASGPSSSKARYFRKRFAERGIEPHIPDLADGDFEHLTISGQLSVIDRSAAGQPIVLIGSSMGGYLSALYAARHTEVERLVLLAPAFCFARRWPESLGHAAVEDWKTSGWREVHHYGEGRTRRLSYQLIEDGLLYEDFPQVAQPALVLHGTRDEVVPVGVSEEFVRRDPGRRRLVTFDSGHELTDVLGQLWSETARFLELDRSEERSI